jgi:hypothetical protein
MANVISRGTGCWIQYQLKLSGLGQKTAAGEANCSIGMASHFLCGRKDSMRVRTALCKVPGYGPFEALAAAGRDHIPPEGGAAWAGENTG